MLEWGLQVDGPITRGWEGGGGLYEAVYGIYLLAKSL